jgi:GNAT superfamily N-acetyltransferase
VIRTAVRDDVRTILRLIHELAAYERAAHEVRATEEDLARDLFGPDPAARVLIAEDAAGRPVGFALWFTTYSTWLGRPGIYLEDLYVTPDARGGGHGRALLAELARIAVDRGYGRVEWSVLDWNEPAIGFYKSLGATPQDEWTVHRLTGEALTALGTR